MRIVCPSPGRSWGVRCEARSHRSGATIARRPPRFEAVRSGRPRPLAHGSGKGLGWGNRLCIMGEEVVPVLRVANTARAVAWYARLGFAKEWEHQFEPGFPWF